MDDRERWVEFINQAYIEFRGDTRKTISDFAEWLGLPQAQVSQYMSKNGKLPRNQAVIAKFYKRYGKRVYDVLGFEVPNDSLMLMPEPLRSIALEIRDTLAEKNIDPQSPEAGLVMDEIMKKHGYNLSSIREEALE